MSFNGGEIFISKTMHLIVHWRFLKLERFWNKLLLLPYKRAYDFFQSRSRYNHWIIDLHWKLYVYLYFPCSWSLQQQQHLNNNLITTSNKSHRIQNERQKISRNGDYELSELTIWIKAKEKWFWPPSIVIEKFTSNFNH